MALSNSLKTQFAKVMSASDVDTQTKKTRTGTAVEYAGRIYVQLDGSDQLTPLSDRIAGVKDGDRVTIEIENHSASLTGNLSDPSVGSTTVAGIENQVEQFNVLIANKADIDQLNAAQAKIDELEANDVTITGKLDAVEANITDLKAENVEITGKLDAAVAEIEDLDATYATIDFANIGDAAIENFFSKSGMIKDLVVSSGTVTGELVGVTIKGDLIEGGTVVADKLVILGDDGLYYKLNTNGETITSEQTEYNSLSGTIITAKSITAEKIAVDDLVAFGATIGGFHITDSSLYSGVKADINNTTPGVYMDDESQFALGDLNNYLRFFKDTDGTYKLEISAQSVKISTSDKTIEDSLDDMQNQIDGMDSTVTTLQIDVDNITSSVTDLEGNYTQLTQTVDGISSTVSDVEGNVSSLTQTVNGISSTVSDVEGSVSTLTQTVNGISGTVGDLEGNYTQLTQTVNGFEASINNANSTANSALSTAQQNGQLLYEYQAAPPDDFGMILLTSDRTISDGGNTGYAHIWGWMGGWTADSGGYIDVMVPLRNTRYHTIVVTQKDNQIKTYGSGEGASLRVYKLNEKVRVTLAVKGYAQVKLFVEGKGFTINRTGGNSTQGTYIWDSDSATAQDAKTATNYLRFDSSGLCVGNMTGTLGYNALITGGEYQIRNGSTVLSSFGSTVARLGQNSTSAQVQMCGGRGVISARGSGIQVRGSSSTTWMALDTSVDIYSNSAGNGLVSEITLGGGSIDVLGDHGVKIGQSGSTRLWGIWAGSKVISCSGSSAYQTVFTSSQITSMIGRAHGRDDVCLAMNGDSAAWNHSFGGSPYWNGSSIRVNVGATPANGQQIRMNYIYIAV